MWRVESNITRVGCRKDGSGKTVTAVGKTDDSRGVIASAGCHCSGTRCSVADRDVSAPNVACLAHALARGEHSQEEDERTLALSDECPKRD